MTRAAILAIVLIAAACDTDGTRAPSAPPPDAKAWFRDVAEAAGLRFRHVSGARGDYHLPEIMGGGVGFLDVDGDGDLDVYAVQSGALGVPRTATTSNRLYRNEGRGIFTDVTERSGGAGGAGYGMGCAAGDYDDDGDVDLYVTNVGPNVLYRNDRGVLTDVTASAGVGDPGWSTSAAFVDYDQDGDLDLFVCNYVAWEATPAFTQKVCHSLNGVRDYCSPQAYGAPAASTLYRNRGDGTFEDVSVASGIASKRGTALGAVCSDLDADGRPDIYVANDQMPSFAWINRGDGTFAESAIELGVAVSETGKSQAGMGVVSADIDCDGDFDLWKVHLYREGHILYLNRGTYFDDVSARFGLLALTRRFTGFGTGVFDCDSDGLLDLFVANGRVEVHGDLVRAADPYAEKDQLLRQTAPGTFADVSDSAGPAFALVECGRGAAFGDYDDDGDVDILVANRDGPLRLLRNESPRRGASLTVRALMRNGRDAYGATVRLAGGPTPRVAEIQAASSYLATNDPRAHFGLGAAATVSLVVTWPSGGPPERFGPVDVRDAAFVTVRQGTGASSK